MNGVISSWGSRDVFLTSELKKHNNGKYECYVVFKADIFYQIKFV